MTRQNDVADAVRRLRERIQVALLEEANVQCARDHVITNDRRHGCRLSGKILVRGVGDDGGNDVQQEEPDTASDLNSRQQWLIEHLAAKGSMQKDAMAAAYRRQFGLSKLTLERDLKALRRRKLIQFAGDKRTGGWIV